MLHIQMSPHVVVDPGYLWMRIMVEADNDQLAVDSSDDYFVGRVKISSDTDGIVTTQQDDYLLLQYCVTWWWTRWVDADTDACGYFVELDDIFMRCL